MIGERAKRKRAQRRRVRFGYPVAEPFASKKEALEYLGGDTIICLLCGREMQSLGLHLWRIHETTVDEYKAKYQLPSMVGLATASNREKHRNQIWENIDRDEHMRLLPERRKAANQKMRDKDFFRPDWAEIDAGSRLLAQLGKKEWLPEDYEMCLDHIRRGIMWRNMPSDVPQQSTFHSYCRKNEEFYRRYRETMDAMPFELQAKHEMLGDRYRKTLRELWDSGETNDYVLADKLGVSVMTVNKLTRRWRNSKRTVVGT